MCIPYEFEHFVISGIADKGYLSITPYQFPDAVGRVHTRNDQGDVEVVENLIDEESGRMRIFRYLDVAMVKGIAATTRFGFHPVVGMKTWQIVYTVFGEVLLEVGSVVPRNAKHDVGMPEHLLVKPQFATGHKEIQSGEEVTANLEKVEIILVLDIALAVYLQPVLKALIPQIIA